MNVQEYQYLEDIFFKTLLGIRFWDPVLDKPIADALQVGLYPIENSAAIVYAYPSRSGIYTFNSIPGLHSYHTVENYESQTSPPVAKQYVLTVEDLNRRYVTVATSVALPLNYDGIFLVDDNSNSPSLSPKGFNLYSSASRISGGQYAFVRGELIDRDSNEPAQHALIQVQSESGHSWYAIADQEGRFAVLMPYPTLDIGINNSPINSDSSMFLFARTWPLTITVMYDPMVLTPLAGTELFDYASILNQNAALIYAHSPQTDVGEVETLAAELEFDRDLIIRTTGFSKLYISSSGSPG